MREKFYTSIIIALLALPAFGQVSPTRNIQAGKLACAGRILNPTTFQTWCYKGTVLGVNSAMDLSNGGANFTYIDNTDGEVMAHIGWVVTPLMNLDTNVQTGWAWHVTITISSNPSTTLNGVF